MDNKKGSGGKRKAKIHADLRVQELKLASQAKRKAKEQKENERPAEQTVLPAAPPSILCPLFPVLSPNPRLGHISAASRAGIKYP